MMEQLDGASGPLDDADGNERCTQIVQLLRVFVCVCTWWYMQYLELLILVLKIDGKVPSEASGHGAACSKPDG